MATWISRTKGWTWGGGDAKFCNATEDYFLFYSLSLRSYRLQHRSTFLWSPFWFTKEFVAANRTPGDGYVINAVIKLNKEREKNHDELKALDAAMTKTLARLSNPVWIVTPKREEDREVADYAEKIINSHAWLDMTYFKEARHMEVIDNRQNSTRPTVLMTSIPQGAIFQGRPNGSSASTFKRVHDHIFELSGVAGSRSWRVDSKTTENRSYYVENYQRVHGKIVIERNA